MVANCGNLIVSQVSKKIHIAWKKTLRRTRKINFRTHNVLINKINRCVPIDVSHASDLIKSKLCIKFVWSLCNSKYALHKRIGKMFLTNINSTIVEHIKFFMCISLFNSINKLFDYIIIDLCGDTLSTTDMQFGYKPNHSTTSCTTVLKNIIKYYLRENSNVYCCFLDASKAFDKSILVNFSKH